MTWPKNQLSLNSIPPCHSLSLIFQTNLPPYQQPKSGKPFPDKPSAKVHSLFKTGYIYYTQLPL